MDTALKPLRFIPYRRADILAMCLDEGGLSHDQQKDFEQFSEALATRLHAHYHGLLEQLKDAYDDASPGDEVRSSGLLNNDVLNGDALNNHPLNSDPVNKAAGNLTSLLRQTLEQANYEQLSETDLQAALKEASLFKVRLKVDFSRFQEVMIFSRGQSQRSEELVLAWGLHRKTITFTHFKRVVLYLKLPASEEQPERVYLKLFENVPKADIEMLFPETEVQMRLRDKLLIGVPALVSGAVVLTTKLGATALLLGSLFGFWLGLHAEPVELNKAALLALLAGFGALGGFIWKQIKNFRTRKLEFVQALTRNLYFKNLANNSSVLHQLIDDAEEEDSKEILLAYYFLLSAGKAMTAQELDKRIENWFAECWQYQLDFEISDALDKLVRFELASQLEGGFWLARPIYEGDQRT